MNENQREIEELIERVSNVIAGAIWEAYRFGWMEAERNTFRKAEAIMNLKEERDDSDQDEEEPEARGAGSGE